MPRGSRPILFEGLFEKDVLGVFNVIRGFADLRDLAKVSVPYTMATGAEDKQVVGHQRQVDLGHAERINQYLERGDNRFLPEIILSLRADIQPEMEGVEQVGVFSDADHDLVIARRWRSKNARVHQVRIREASLQQILEQRRIRRIDGNHRLALADQLVDDEIVPRKYLAPFCMILLGLPGDGADDYAESLIFHTINSTAVPLEAEHSLTLILGQDAEHSMTPEEEFAYDPALHLTRVIRDGIRALPQPAQDRLGSRPLTALSTAARSTIATDPSIVTDLNTLRIFGTNFVAGLNEIIPNLWNSRPKLVKTAFFVELMARIWIRSRDENHDERVDSALRYLNGLGAWLTHNDLIELKDTGSLGEQLLQIYDGVRTHLPKRAFLARWLPSEDDGSHLTRANLRLEQIQRTLRELESEHGVSLELIDMGTQTGGTFPIHAEMYKAISSADLILIDLTGVRPNVCVEAGYALQHHEADRLIFLYQRGHNLLPVPFDLNTFRYEPFDDTAEIPAKLKPHISSILRNSGLVP